MRLEMHVCNQPVKVKSEDGNHAPRGVAHRRHDLLVGEGRVIVDSPNGRQLDERRRVKVDRLPGASGLVNAFGMRCARTKLPRSPVSLHVSDIEL